MNYDNEYTPKIIIAEDYYDDYMLELHRELSTIAENKDPPNPFRPKLEEGNVKIVINDTNDLHWCIKYFERKIIDGELKYVIIGDPNSFGYGDTILDNMSKDINLSFDYMKSKQWIITMINIDNKKLIIENNRLNIR